MLAPILSIQSHVVYGHVGNSAAVFPLQRLGREVWPLMTVQFSSHTGYAGWRGRAFDAAMIDDCVSGLQAIGVLSRCAGLLTGYLGKAEIGEAALRALERLRAANGEAAYACDPVIGDVGRGSYVAAGVGEFFRDRALPAATIATPNAFELEWLTGERAHDLQTARRAIAALRGARTAGRRGQVAQARRYARRRAGHAGRATKRASGDYVHPCCRLRSTAPATCSRRSSFIIGSRRVTRPRRCHARRRRFTRS